MTCLNIYAHLCKEGASYLLRPTELAALSPIGTALVTGLTVAAVCKPDYAKRTLNFIFNNQVMKGGLMGMVAGTALTTLWNVQKQSVMTSAGHIGAIAETILICGGAPIAGFVAGATAGVFKSLFCDRFTINVQRR